MGRMKEEFMRLREQQMIDEQYMDEQYYLQQYKQAEQKAAKPIENGKNNSSVLPENKGLDK